MRRERQQTDGGKEGLEAHGLSKLRSPRETLCQRARYVSGITTLLPKQRMSIAPFRTTIVRQTHDTAARMARVAMHSHQSGANDALVVPRDHDGRRTRRVCGTIRPIAPALASGKAFKARRSAPMLDIDEHRPSVGRRGDAGATGSKPSSFEDVLTSAATASFALERRSQRESASQQAAAGEKGLRHVIERPVGGGVAHRLVARFGHVALVGIKHLPSPA